MKRRKISTGENKLNKMIKVKSSTIEQIGYFDKKNILSIMFKRGAVYNYSNFTLTDWVPFLNAESIGKHFHAHIKGKFPFEKQG